MLRCFRVAAPSIRIVPWAARASCWPLPQQLLPVSAAGGGRRRCCTYSAERIFYFAFVALCGALQTLFSQKGRNGKRQVQTLPSSPSQALTRQLPQRGSLWRNCTLCNLTGDFPAMPRPLPLGEVASRSDDGEGEPAAPQRRAFAESGAAPAIFLYDPSREKVSRENPQIFPGDKL